MTVHLYTKVVHNRLSCLCITAAFFSTRPRATTVNSPPREAQAK